jgi:hypothetical protein
MSKVSCAAIDMGASNGRVVVAETDGERISLREALRFETPLVGDPCGYHCWDVDLVEARIREGLREAQAAAPISSVGVDTWGVDFVLLDDALQRVAPAVSYRDVRTQGAMERLFARLPAAEVYRRTGVQFQAFNTLDRAADPAGAGRRGPRRAGGGGARRRALAVADRPGGSALLQPALDGRGHPGVLRRDRPAGPGRRRRPGPLRLREPGAHLPTCFSHPRSDVVDGLLLHVSRPVRWDSDHVVVLDDETQAVATELVRAGRLDQVALALDFFDASINWVAAWVIGTRNVRRALLRALLAPAWASPRRWSATSTRALSMSIFAGLLLIVAIATPLVVQRLAARRA